MKLRFIDLFAGIGGIRKGFELACSERGINTECVFTSEIKPYAVEVLKQNHPDEDICGDITQVDEMSIPDFDVLLAGFPCQAFSAAGKRLGFEEVTYLLLFGKLPNREELDGFMELLSDSRVLPKHFVRDVILKASGKDMMTALAKAVLTLASYDNDVMNLEIDNVLRQCLKLISLFPLLTVYSYHDARRNAEKVADNYYNKVCELSRTIADAKDEDILVNVLVGCQLTRKFNSLNYSIRSDFSFIDERAVSKRLDFILTSFGIDTQLAQDVYNRIHDCLGFDVFTIKAKNNNVYIICGNVDGVVETFCSATASETSMQFITRMMEANKP